MNHKNTLFPALLIPLVLTGCGLEEKIKDAFVDYATPLSEQTSNPNEVARVLPLNPVGCPDWRQNETIKITESLTLPAGCKYDRVNITISNQSDLIFDCNGAEFNGLNREFRQAVGKSYSVANAPLDFGIKIQSTEHIQSNNVTVKNCKLTNFVRGIRIGFGLSADSLADLKNNVNVSALEENLRSLSPKNIKVENCTINYSHKDGVFVERFVTDFILDKSAINFTGAVGLYLDSGSQNNTIRNSKFTQNGHSDYDITKRIRKRKLANDSREAIAIDSSARNTIINNTFSKNSRGAVFIYKNCNEHAQNPRQIPRYQSADNNLITNNQFSNEAIGVWIASRQSKNLEALECGSPVVATGKVSFGPKKEDASYYEDFAKFNQVTNNIFTNVKNSVLVEDDNSSIINNTFEGSTSIDIQVGTKYRTEKLSHPVTATLIEGNRFNSNSSEPIRLNFNPVGTRIINNIPATVNTELTN